MDKKTTSAYILSKRDPAQNKRSTQTECKGMEKNITSKQTWKKKSGGRNTYVKQNRLQQRP